MQVDNQALIIIAPREIKDDLVDDLMQLDIISGFSLTVIDGYSREHSHYSVDEQVEGYRRFFRFEILHRTTQEQQILEALKQTCGPANIRYWLQPVSKVGRFKSKETK